LGFSTVGQNQINMNIRVNKFKLAQKNFLNTLNLSILLNIVFSIFFFSILKELFDNGFLKFETIKSNEFYLIAVLLIFYTFTHQINGLFVSIYAAHNKYYFKIRLGYLSKILETFILFYCLYNNYNFETILLYFLFCKILFFIFIIFDTTKNYDWIKFSFKLEKDYIRNNLSHALSYLLFPITNALKYQSTNLIINSVMGPKYVALLSIYLTLARVIINFTSITDGIIKIELAKLWISKQLEYLKKIFIFNIQITLYASVLIILSLILLNEKIFEIWIGKNFIIDQKIFLILLFSTLFLSLFNSSVALLTSTNNFKKITFYNFLNAIIFILILYILINIHTNLFVVAILFLISDLIIFYNALDLSSKMINVNLFNNFLKILSLKNFKNSAFKIIKKYGKN
jgi:O-antigen/teichoic acid export membrane protein